MVFRERAPELLGSNCLESKCNCEPYKILQGFVQNCYGYKVAELLDSNRSVSVSSLSENFLDGLPETWYHKDVANGIPFIQVKTGAERKALRPFFLHGITVLCQSQTLFSRIFRQLFGQLSQKVALFLYIAVPAFYCTTSGKKRKSW